MEIRPTLDQEAFIHAAIEAGRIGSPEDAAREALALWEERERRRIEILSAVDAAEASYARGSYSRVTTPDEAAALAERIKKRGRELLAAQQSAAE